MRILQVGNLQIRRYGKARVSTENKLYNGLVRNNHQVLHFGDRDMASFLAPFGWRDLGVGKMNRKFIETARNFRPDMILLGHCDLVKNESLKRVREFLPEIRIAFRNVDPLFVPHNVAAIHARCEVVDSIFITTAGDNLRQFKNGRASVHYMPNPCDAAIDVLDNSCRDDLPYDLFFCGNSNEHTQRKDSVVHLKKELENDALTFKTFGFFDEPPVWGHDYTAVLAKSKMGLNLNRQEDFLYSSDRLAQLMGNGILPFIDRAGGMQELLGEENAVFYDRPEELPEKIRALAANDHERKAIAARGRAFYRRHFNSDAVARYIVERSMGQPLSQDYLWADY